MDVQSVDYPVLNAGNSRICFDRSENTVLKVTKKRNYQNRMEVKQWLNNKELREYLAEIIDYSEDFSWLIMRKYNTVTKEEANNFYHRLSKKGIYPTDTSPSNVGKLGDTYKLIDYGNKIRSKNI